MILAFDGRPEPMRRLVKELGIGKTRGAYLPRLGTLFLDRGYDVTIIGWERWFPHRLFWTEPGSAERELRRCACRDRRSKYSRQLVEFLDKGGRYELRPVTLADIARCLRTGRPPIINFNSALLCTRREHETRHVSVVTGLSRHDVTINDPSHRYGGTRTYAIDRLLYCCHTVGGQIVCITPKK